MRLDYVLPRTQVIAESTVPWTIEVSVGGTTDLSTVYSPSHPVEVSRKGPDRVVVAWERVSAFMQSTRG